MKKFLLSLCLALYSICIGSGITVTIAGEKESGFKLQLTSETKKYIQDCSEKIYPENLDEINIYNDDLKALDEKYHQCIKFIIISKINKVAVKKDADRLIQSLDKIQEGILDFYWNLYNREDNGTIGREANDAAMGFYYEALLDDIIRFQQHFIESNDDIISKP